MKNTRKILTVLIPILIFSCGFKPLKQKSNNQIFLQNVNIVGEQKVAYLLKNNILLISDKNSPNIYDVSIKLIKQNTRISCAVCNNFNINFELNGNSNENLISNFHSLPNSPDANCSSNQLFKAERHRDFLL